MSNCTSAQRKFAVQQTCELRNQASDLLNQLLDHREQSEARFAEVGRTDPIKSITGRSAIDNAIESTRRLIRELDEWLDGGAASAERASDGAASNVNGRRIAAAP